MRAIFRLLKLVLSLFWFIHFEVLFADPFSPSEDEPLFLSEEDDDSVKTTTVSTVMEKDLPLDLYDIGYMGTWERFCDPDEIEKEFSLYPHYHVLKRMRNLICDLRQHNQIDKNAVMPFTVYKYCDSIRTRVDTVLAALIQRFSLNDDTKKAELLDEGPLMDFTGCYKEAIMEFRRHCMGEANPYFEMFKPLIGRACFVEWLTVYKIIDHIREVCKGKWINDQIDWGPILSSIKYRDDRGGTATGITTSFAASPASSIANLSRSSSEA